MPKVRYIVLRAFFEARGHEICNVCIRVTALPTVRTAIWFVKVKQSRYYVFQVMCQQFRGYLAEVDTPEENTFLQNTIDSLTDNKGT